MASQNDQTMQYGRLPLPDRRDSNLDSNGSTPFQSHQNLGQALGTHIAGTVPPYTSPDPFRNLPSSPGLQQNAAPSQPHQPQSHSPLFSVPSTPGMKRKPDTILGAAQQFKRGRHADTDSGDTFDIDGSAQGAKHWTDEEKTRLFTWLMGQGQDEHWSSLRATKNSCLRECAIEVFGNKKTYQALKGCYERNFNLFKQIYAFENFHAHSTNVVISGLSEPDRLREYERRLQTARKSGCDVGNINARTIDHWHRIGWYDLFFRRWQGDPATTKSSQPRNSAAPANASGSGGGGGGGDDGDDDDPQLDFPDSIALDTGLGALGQGQDRTHPITFITQQQTPRESIPPIPLGVGTSMGRDGVGVGGAGAPPPPQSPTNGDQAVVNLSITQGMMSTYLQFLQVQTQTGKMKLEYLRRREEREERESAQRRELERLKMERDVAEFEHNKQNANVQQKTDRALDLLNNPSVDASVKQAAGDYLKKLFAAAD